MNNFPESHWLNWASSKRRRRTVSKGSGLTCSVPGCTNKVHGVVTTAGAGALESTDINVPEQEIKRTPVCKEHIPGDVKNTLSLLRTGDTSEDYTLESADDIKGFIPLNRREVEVEKIKQNRIDLPVAAIARKGRRERTANAVSSHEKMISSMVKNNDTAGLRKHIDSVMGSYVSGAVSWAGLPSHHRALLKSLDSNNNLDYNLYKKHISAVRRNLKKNEVRRTAPSTPNIFTQVGQETDVRDLPLGERSHERPDVRERNQSDEHRAKLSQAAIRAGSGDITRIRNWEESGGQRPGRVSKLRTGKHIPRPDDTRIITAKMQGPVSDIIALRKAHISGEFGDVMSEKEAKGHLNYAKALKEHVKSGGTEETFLNQFTDMGKKSRTKKTLEQRDGQTVQVTQLPTAKASNQPLARNEGVGAEGPRRAFDWSSLVPPPRKPETNDRRR